jgi:hypothetical protein
VSDQQADGEGHHAQRGDDALLQCRGALSGLDSSSTSDAAVIEPAPAKTRAAPAAVAPVAKRTTPMATRIGEEQVVEALVEGHLARGLGFFGAGAERGAGARLVQAMDSSQKMKTWMSAATEASTRPTMTMGILLFLN